MVGPKETYTSADNRLNEKFAEVQRYFMLAALSYTDLFEFNGGTERDLLHTLSDAFNDRSFISKYGKWEVVWGPVVRQFKLGEFSLPKRNTFFVVYNKSLKEYVICITGTNPISPFGWFVEDFEIGQLVPWEAACDSPTSKSGAKIALGTFAGLTKLQQSKPSSLSRPIGQPETLLNFLHACLLKHMREETLEGVRISVCGHSLGGTLTPVVGLWLQSQLRDKKPSPQENEDIASQIKYWEKATNLYTWSFAGATPGNEIFASEFDKEFKVGSTQSRAYRIWNTLDVVPHAWEPSLFAKIETLYTPTLHLSKVAGLALKEVVDTQIELGDKYKHPGTSIPLEHKIPYWRRHLPIPNLPFRGVNLAKWMSELAYQHTLAYSVLLDTPLSPAVTRALLPPLDLVPFSSHVATFGLNLFGRVYSSSYNPNRTQVMSAFSSTLPLKAWTPPLAATSKQDYIGGKTTRKTLNEKTDTRAQNGA